MKARVSESCKWHVVTAFAGREYVKNEWRDVPSTARKQAELHPFLEIKPPKIEVVVKPPAPVKKAVAKRKLNPRRKPAPKKVVTDD